MITHEFGNTGSQNVLIQLVDDHDLETLENEIKNIKELSHADFCLIAVKVKSWNTDLSPWRAAAVFGKEDFGDGAEKTLSEVTALCSDPGKDYYVGGYSLAGLFALWAAYNTAHFKGAAAASPSVWFPGFTDFMRTHELKAGAVYLSLGDREEKTRNPVMATVGEKIREAYSILKEQGADCTLEWNQGNHFKDADLRTAKAFAWLLNR